MLFCWIFENNCPGGGVKHDFSAPGFGVSYFLCARGVGIHLAKKIHQGFAWGGGGSDLELTDALSLLSIDYLYQPATI